jgi:hypothetical protein
MLFYVLTKNGHVYVNNFFLFFRISKNFRNLYVVRFILVTSQNYSLEGGGHTVIKYLNRRIILVWKIVQLGIRQI